MLKRYKDLMHTLVIELRHILVGTVASDGAIIRGDLDRELERLGIAPDGSIAPFDVLANPTPGERQAYRVAVTQLEACDKAQRASTRMEIVERAAYSWINRLLALRAMETRGLIEETLRNNPDYDGIPEALFILRNTDPGRASGADGGRWAVLEDACMAQAAALSGLFALNDPATALRPSTPALIRCMTLVGGTMAGFTLAESDAAFADPDAIGWAYQFYQEEAKSQIDAKCKSGSKVSTRGDIAAKTELFTEPYMVKWLLQNSLGCSYHEIYPDSTLPATWDYYVKPDQFDTSTTFSLGDLTVLDPCMGSGHFLREAFDMLVAMYREQFHTLSATEIADHILSHHLYGVDIDPRAAQLSALTLYLRAWELVRDERRKERKGPGTYTPPAMNLATTPTSLSVGALHRHLRRHPQDMPLKPLLEGIFAGLEHADILGSLLRPKEYLDHAIAELQRPYTIRIDFDPTEAEFRRTITEMANHDPAGLRQMLLERIADAFKAEAGNTDDVSAALFGHEAELGVRLLQLLDHRYAVVVTNPPYMGHKYMDTVLKKYVEKYYQAGKRDLYAAFILRCLELCQSKGRVAMITQHNWMFLRRFMELRTLPEEKLIKVRKTDTFRGLLQETSIELIAHLGPNAFEEIGGEVVQTVMFTLVNNIPSQLHIITAFRLVGLKDKAAGLKKMDYIHVNQNALTFIPESPICYWLSESWLTLLSSEKRLDTVALVREGVHTTDNSRFLRCFWECKGYDNRWFPYVKGGGYGRWAGLEWLCVDWQEDGRRIRATKAPVIPSYELYFRPGLTYTDLANGALGVRFFPEGRIFDAQGPVIAPYAGLGEDLACLANSRPVTYMLRAISPTLHFRTGYVKLIPVPEEYQSLKDLGVFCIALATLEHQFVITESLFQANLWFWDRKRVPDLIVQNLQRIDIVNCLRLMTEALIEQKSYELYKLDLSEIQESFLELGIPAGWHPLIAGYDALPFLPADLGLPPLPQEPFDYFETRERIQLNEKELARIKANLRVLYEAGPGAKNIEQEETDETTEDEEGEEEIALGAHIPIPTETFLEELSVKMQLHPITVYWLLEELRAEGVRCKPEEQRLLEDRLSVLVLRLLGYRWPKQIEIGEPVPDWADRDGIIPLVAGTGKATLAEQVRARLRTEDGELGAQKTEALVAELTNLSLEEWLRKRFFSRHVSQFKYRPIAWHLVSTPANNGKRKRGGSQRGPAFECFLYYHACISDTLARIRTQYVELLIRAERQRIEEVSLFRDETESALAHDRIRELETFAEKLRLIEERGFACSELEKIIAEEPLDRWSGDGYLPPASRDEMLHNEQAWHVDINDGVRVNIAPLQLAGVLASDVLKAVDAKKAIADRAHWRGDERHWVRAGKLPRCGWMDEAVPESPRWTERETERVAEQMKLQQKRLALEHKYIEEVEL